MRFITKAVCWLLANQRLGYEDYIALSNKVLDVTHALPLRGIIETSEMGTLLIGGREVDMEKARQLRESAKASLNSSALKLIDEQVAFVAITVGIHKAETPEQLLFGKAALWWGQQQHSLLKLLAGDPSGNVTPNDDY